MSLLNTNGNIPNGTTSGSISLLNIQNSNGNVFWVDKNHYAASDSNKGTFIKPLKTLQRAIDKCRPNQGDRIYIAASHSENLTSKTPININVEGIQIIGLGLNKQQPLFLFSDVETTFEITARSVYISNIRLLGFPAFGGTSLSHLLLILARDTYLENVVFENVSHDNGAESFVEVGRDFNGQADNTSFVSCTFRGKSEIFDIVPNMVGGITVRVAINNLNIHSCSIVGKFEKGCIFDDYTYPSGGTSSDIRIDGDNYFQNALEGQSYKVIDFGGAKTAYISRNTIIATLDVDTPEVRMQGRAGRGINGDYEYIIADISHADLWNGGAGYQLATNLNGAYMLEDFTFETDFTALAPAVGSLLLRKLNETNARGEFLFYSITAANVTANTTHHMGDVLSTVSNYGTITSGSDIVVSVNNNPTSTGFIRVTLSLRKISDASFYFCSN